MTVNLQVAIKKKKTTQSQVTIDLDRTAFTNCMYYMEKRTCTFLIVSVCACVCTGRQEGDIECHALSLSTFFL